MRKIAERYGVPLQTLGRLELDSPNRLGVDTAFTTNETLDRQVPSKTPEPSTVNGDDLTDG